MTRRDYDVVIVGARCAGAALAAFLARAGARVLLLDRDPQPSDHVISTHSMNPRGMDVLDALGIGDAVRAGVPRSCILRMAIPAGAWDLELPVERAVYCPRRERLDGLIQGAAVSAGAALRDRTRVTGLVEENGRVCGVRAADGDGQRTYTAGLVVGSDGRHSTIARLVRADEYLGYDAPRAVFWGYWNAPAFWRTDPAYRFDYYFSSLDGVIRVIFQTEHDQLMIAAGPPVAEAGPFRAEPLAALRRSLEADPVIARIIENNEPDGKIRGTVNERYFFRRAAGPGWALVGDAGHHKEFAIGDGMTEALLQAQSLAEAIGAGTDAALVRWWRARDVEALPLYFMGQDAASLEPPLEVLQMLYERMAELPDVRERLVAVIDRRVSPLEAFPPLRVLGWVASAVLRGRWRLLGEVLAAARRGIAARREIRARERLLAEASV